VPNQLPESLFEYPEPPQTEAFVDGVMQRVKRAQQTRKFILIGAGLAGALFGVTGAILLSANIGQLITASMSTTGPMPVSLAIIATVGFLAWLLADEPGLAQ